MSLFRVSAVCTLLSKRIFCRKCRLCRSCNQTNIPSICLRNSMHFCLALHDNQDLFHKMKGLNFSAHHFKMRLFLDICKHHNTNLVQILLNFKVICHFLVRNLTLNHQSFLMENMFWKIEVGCLRALFKGDKAKWPQLLCTYSGYTLGRKYKPSIHPWVAFGL